MENESVKKKQPNQFDGAMPYYDAQDRTIHWRRYKQVSFNYLLSRIIEESRHKEID